MDELQQDLPKHFKYRKSYRSFDYYWGLGVEHETYIKTSQTKEISTFEGCMKPERYSVNYMTIYEPEKLRDSLRDLLFLYGGKISVPILINSHSFTHADVYTIHRTTYEKKPKPNPQYAGETFFDWICKHSVWLKTELDKGFMWDGDTIEFMTQHFYKATTAEVMNELRTITDRFNKELGSLPKQGLLVAYGPLKLAMPVNEPFAIHLTNLRNVAMFNNGTLHINLTLPTRLGWGAKPLWKKKFIKRHQILARLIQWLEPVFVALYGSGDPLARTSDRYAKGSQRVAISRYIGIGTFDTETMPAGKILQIQRGAIPWYDRLVEQTNYLSLEKIGLDLNFQKHGAHGLELRFFDQMSYDLLENVLKHLVLLMDYSMILKDAENPVKNPVWQRMATAGILEGGDWILQVEEIQQLCWIFKLTEFSAKEPMGVAEVMEVLFQHLLKFRGFCWKHMVEGIAEKPVGCF
jgi:hypothetical protein